MEVKMQSRTLDEQEDNVTCLPVKKNFLSLETAERIDKIQHELWEIFQALRGEYNPKFTCEPNPTDGDVYDFLGNLKYQIIAKLDGRPQPLDFARGTELYAECFSPGYTDKAHIGNIHLSLDELIKVRNWIDQVVDWHQQNPGKKNDSFI